VQGGGGRRKGNETSSSQTIKPDAVKRSTCQASLKSIWSSASADNGSENLVAEAGTDHQEDEHEQSMIVERKTKVEEPRVGGTVTPTPHKAVQVQGEASISPAAEIESSPSTVQQPPPPPPQPFPLAALSPSTKYSDFVTLATKRAGCKDFTAVSELWSEFKRIHHPPSPPKPVLKNLPASTSSPAFDPENPEGLSAYELRRLERMKRNDEFLKKLGLTSCLIPDHYKNGKAAKKGGGSKKAKTVDRSKSASLVPTRRSTRTRGEKPVDYSSEKIVDSSKEEETVSFDENWVVHNDEEVIKYSSCPSSLKAHEDSGKAPMHPSSPPAPLNDWWSLSYPSNAQGPMFPPSLQSVLSPSHFHFSGPASASSSTAVLAPSSRLQKIYTLSFSSSVHPASTLIAGGGGCGIVNVWGLQDRHHLAQGDDAADEQPYEDEDGKSPRDDLCWKASPSVSTRSMQELRDSGR